MLRARHTLAAALHAHLQGAGLLQVHAPVLTGNDCEGAGELFTAVAEQLQTDGEGGSGGGGFFGRPAYLTVSGQLHLEAFAAALSRVYSFGPTFRAENSHTSRHLAEFWMIEPEIAFATLAEDMALAEDFLKFCTQWVLDHCAEDLAFFEEVVEKGLRERLRNVVAEPFQHLTYTAAIELLLKPEHQKAGKFKEKVYWGVDLASEHERYITEKVFKKPVILTNYPKDIKAFYMKLDEDGRVRGGAKPSPRVRPRRSQHPHAHTMHAPPPPPCRRCAQWTSWCPRLGRLLAAASARTTRKSCARAWPK